MDGDIHSMKDRLILNNSVTILERAETDVTALPAGSPPDASLISEADWLIMVENAGSEATLLADLGVEYADEN